MSGDPESATPPLTSSEVDRRTRDLWGESRVELSILFGSVARGSARDSSDVDLAVRAEPGTDLVALEMALARRLRTGRIDLVDLTRASPLLTFQIARTGHVLYERTPGAFPAFASLALRRYVDTAKLRRARERGIRDFLEKEGLR